MLLDMAVRGRNHPDDVVVLKCPECRTTEPLGDADINSFPVNKKILEKVSNGQSSGDDDGTGDDDLIEKFKHVSMDTYANDPEQTRPMVPFGTANGWNHDRDQIELSNRGYHQDTIPRGYPNDPFKDTVWNGNGTGQDYIPDEYLLDSMQYGMETFDDRSYMDDVRKQLDVTEDTIHHNDRKIEENSKEEEDNVMAAIRRSCAEMYGTPSPAENNPDLVTDGPVGENNWNLSRQGGRNVNVSPEGARNSQNGLTGRWTGLPGATNGNRHQSHWKKHHFFGHGGFQRGSHRERFAGGRCQHHWESR